MSFIGSEVQPSKTDNERGKNIMERLIGGIVVILGLIAIIRSYSGRIPNVDVDTGLDHHPMPTEAEMAGLGEKYTLAEDREYWARAEKKGTRQGAFSLSENKWSEIYSLYLMLSNNILTSSGMFFGIFASTIMYMSPVFHSLFLHFSLILNFVHGFVHSGIFNLRFSP